MLKLYDYLETMMEEHNSRQWYYETKLNYFASEIIDMLEVDDASEIALSLSRAFQACDTLNIPFSKNFKRVYRYNDEGISSDWKISSLACYLLIINSNPNNESVAKAQIYFAMNQVANK